MTRIQTRVEQYLEPGRDQSRTKAYFITRLGGFGDVIMALGAINAIRQAHPDARIHFLTEDRYAPIARLCPFITQVYTEEKAFTLAMQTSATDRTQKVVKCEWGHVFFGINRDHEINAFLEDAELSAPNGQKEAVLQFEPRMEEFLRKKVQGLLSGAPGKRIVLHPARGDANRTWPVEHWNALIRLIIAAGHTPILVGDDSAIPFKGVLHPESRPEVLDLTNLLSFFELIALFWMADVFVSPDSGPVQIAGTTGVGLVGIYTTVPARCRLPFRNGFHGWKAVGLEPACPRKGCYQLLLKDDAWHARLQEAFRRDHALPGSQATNTFMGEFCPLDGPRKYTCLEEITPKKVWEACSVLLHTDFGSLSQSLEEARNLAERGDFAGAVPLLRAGLAVLPLPDVQLQLAQALLLSGSLPEAVEVLETLLKTHPSAEALNLLAMASYHRDDLDGAERIGQLAREWNSHFPPAQANWALYRAHRALEESRYLEGLFALERYQAHRERTDASGLGSVIPEDTALVLRGFLTIGLGQSDQAIQTFTQASRINGSNAMAAYGLAESHHAAGSIDQAVEWYRRTLALQPTFEPAVARLQALGV